MQARTQLKCGATTKLATNHNELLAVRTALRAGGIRHNHNEALRVRSTLRAGKLDKLATNHNEIRLG